MAQTLAEMLKDVNNTFNSFAKFGVIDQWLMGKQYYYIKVYCPEIGHWLLETFDQGDVVQTGKHKDGFIVTELALMTLQLKWS